MIRDVKLYPDVQAGWLWFIEDETTTNISQIYK